MSAQDKVLVKGSVTDAAGEALPGAIVSLRQAVLAETSFAKWFKWKASYNFYYYDRRQYVYTSSEMPPKNQ